MVLVDVLIVRMMAQLATENVVAVDHLLHPAAIVAGQRRVDLEAAPTARTMVQLVSANVVGAGPRLHHLAHLAHQAQVGMPPTVQIQARTSMLIMASHSSLELVGTSMGVGA